MQKFIAIVLILFFGVGAFYGGINYQKRKIPQPTGQQPRSELGLVTEITESVVTYRQGNIYKTALYDPSTIIRVSREGTPKEVKLGDEITVYPKSFNSNGTINASMIIKRMYSASTSSASSTFTPTTTSTLPASSTQQ